MEAVIVPMTTPGVNKLRQLTVIGYRLRDAAAGKPA
jgi:hypothetical protein